MFNLYMNIHHYASEYVVYAPTFIVSIFYIFYILDPGSTNSPMRFNKSTTVHTPTTSTIFHKSTSDPPSYKMTKTRLSQQGYHVHQKRSNTNSDFLDRDYTLSEPIYSLSSNWTFPWDQISKSTITTDDQISKMLVESVNENGLLLDDDSILKRLSEETKTPVVFLSENNTAINAHSGTSVTLPCIIKKESKFEMVSSCCDLFKLYSTQ